MGKNYVEEFMKENNLKFGQKFQVKDVRKIYLIIFLL